jgi:hypothetical protein
MRRFVWMGIVLCAVSSGCATTGGAANAPAVGRYQLVKLPGAREDGTLYMLDTSTGAILFSAGGTEPWATYRRGP